MREASCRLPRRFFTRPVEEVAPDLLGRVLRHASPDGVVGLRLTEVEAYSGRGEDPASHAHRGQTARNAVMFGPAGHLYVYFVYGMHWCVNIVCGAEGQASAVLVRAGEVVLGVDLARRRRPGARRDVDLARGPARLASALGISRADGGADLCTAGSAFEVRAGTSVPPTKRDSGPRVGVAAAQNTLWRWWVTDDPTVSTWRPGR